MTAGSNVPSLVGPAQPGGQVIQLGLVRAASLAAVTAEEDRAAEERQSQPLIVGLAGHIRHKFTIARDAKRQYIEVRMLRNLRSRRGEYDPQKLAQIRQMGGSEVFAGLTGLKCRSAASWLKDVISGTGIDRPWSIKPTPVPDLPPEMNELIVEQATQPLKQAIMAGQQPDMASTVSMVSMLRDQALAAVRDEAAKRCDRMADKMEDQLLEGGFSKALDEFINDLTTFPSALIKGPVIRMRPRLTWGANGQPVVQNTLVKEWERVDPFKLYPSPQATTVDDGDLIEKHQLSRADLQALKGVPGYDDAAIDKVLETFNSGLNQWMFDSSEQALAEGRPTTLIANNSDGLIDALQFWGSVQGQLLLDWGMDKSQVPQPTREYQVEAWLIGPYVIKAVLNPDPLCRRPYYKASYEEVPGSFWGNSVADLVNDCQDIANASVRSLVNNAALSSGPQVGVLVDRMAVGEDVTQMFPWRIWQMTSDPMNGTPQPPIQFFQPSSNAQELMGVFERFSLLADEYSGIPRYMTGDSRAGGAGRTASGLSMLMTNAGKSIRAVVANVDNGVIEPVLERLYYYNMRYETDPDLKGDVCISARGAANLIAKESAQVRRTEFLAATANPIDMEIVGIEGRAQVLRETAKSLDMDADKIVPPIEILRQRWAAKQALAAAQPAGTPPGPGSTQGNEQTLMDGAPVADNF
jgi:hypothetical protein